MLYTSARFDRKSIQVYSKIFIVILILIVLSSCNKANKIPHSNIIELNFGVSEYHPKFLFSKEKNEVLTKKLSFKFNEWAKEDKSYVQIVFYNAEDNKRLNSDNKVCDIIINGEKIESDSYSLDSKTNSNGIMEVNFQFIPNAKSRLINGYIAIENTNLDRINNVQNIKDEPILVWSAYQQVSMNPLKKWLLISLAIVAIVFVLWMIFLRPFIYRRFSSNKKLTIISPFHRRINLKSGIILVLTNKKEKQSFWSKLLIGKKIYFISDIFNSPIIIKPTSKKKIHLRLDKDYTISPYSTIIAPGNNTYKITNNNTNTKIEILYK